MIGGYAAAFRDPGIAAACAGGPRGAIAVALLFWSGAWPSMRPPSGGPEVAVPWTAAGRARRPPRRWPMPSMPPRACRCRARPRWGRAWRPVSPCWRAARRRRRRLVLDVSGDGRHNQGRAARPGARYRRRRRRHPQRPGGAERGAGPARALPGRGDRRPRQLRHGLPGLRRLRRRRSGKSWRGRSAGFSCPGRMGYLPSAS